MTQNTAEALTLTVNLDGYNYRAAIPPMRRRRLPVLTRARPLALFLFVASYALNIALEGRLPSGWATALAIFPLVPVLFYLFSSLFLNFQLWKSIRTAPFRQGDITWTLDAQAFTTTKPGHRTYTEWSQVLDVIDSKDGLLLLIGYFEAIVLPASAIPDDMSQAELKDRIRGWINAAPR